MDETYMPRRLKQPKLMWVNDRTAEYNFNFFARIAYNPTRGTYEVFTNNYVTTCTQYPTFNDARNGVEALFALEHD